MNSVRHLQEPAVIVAYQDVTAESGNYANNINNFEDEFATRPEMEESFCSNFVCCGQYLPDLHALLQHYEDCHVRFEEFDDGGYDGSGMSYNNQSQPHPTTGKHRRKRMLAVELEQCDFLTDDANVVSAFDNTVYRTISGTPSINSGLPQPHIPRSQSVPPVNYQRLQPLTGHVDSPMDQYRFIHSILSATVDPPTAGSSSGQLPVVSFTAAASATASQISSNARALPLPPQPSYLRKSDRPYICPVVGCGKAYKNPNGLKYHEKHGHDAEAESVERPHKCGVPGCGKRYKNPNGLKYHMSHAHPNFVRQLSSHSNGSLLRGDQPDFK